MIILSYTIFLHLNIHQRNAILSSFENEFLKRHIPPTLDSTMKNVSHPYFQSTDMETKTRENLCYG